MRKKDYVDILDSLTTGLDREAGITIVEAAINSVNNLSNKDAHTKLQLLDLENANTDDLVGDLYERLQTANDVINYLMDHIIRGTDITWISVMRKAWSEVKRMHEAIREERTLINSPDDKLIEAGLAELRINNQNYQYIKANHLRSLKMRRLGKEKEDIMTILFHEVLRAAGFNTLTAHQISKAYKGELQGKSIR